MTRSWILIWMFLWYSTVSQEIATFYVMSSINFFIFRLHMFCKFSRTAQRSLYNTGPWISDIKTKLVTVGADATVYVWLRATGQIYEHSTVCIVGCIRYSCVRLGFFMKRFTVESFCDTEGLRPVLGIRIWIHNIVHGSRSRSRLRYETTVYCSSLPPPLFPSSLILNLSPLLVN